MPEATLDRGQSVWQLLFRKTGRRDRDDLHIDAELPTEARRHTDGVKTGHSAGAEPNDDPSEQLFACW